MPLIGEKIRLLREQLNMTQEALGAKCGTTKQTIFKYENGIVTNIPMDKLETIAKALGVTPSYLMGWDEPGKESSRLAELEAAFKKNKVLFDAAEYATPAQIKQAAEYLEWLTSKSDF